MKLKAVRNHSLTDQPWGEKLVNRWRWFLHSLWFLFLKDKSISIFAPVRGLIINDQPPTISHLITHQQLGPTWIFESRDYWVVSPIGGRLIYCSDYTLVVEHPAGIKCLLTVINPSQKLVLQQRVGSITTAQTTLWQISANRSHLLKLKIALILLPVTMEGKNLVRCSVSDQVQTTTLIGKIS